MGFQQSVNIFPAIGLPGELAFSGPIRSAPANIFSNGTPNIIGYAYTWTANAQPTPPGASPNAGVAQVGGTGVFAGILMSPKEQAAVGTTGNPLGASLALPDNWIGELLTMGQIFVSLPGPANQGDIVTFDPSTGALNSITPNVQFTGSIAAGGTAGTPDVLTVTAVAQGTLQVGMLIDPSAGVEGGTYILSLGTGKGGTGTYNLSTINQQTVTSRALVGNSIPPTAFVGLGYITTAAGVDTLHITTATSGEVLIGSLIQGAGVAANTVVTALGTGVGGVGTYILNTSGQVVASVGVPEAMTTPSEVIIPRAKVLRFGAGTIGGVAAIELTS